MTAILVPDGFDANDVRIIYCWITWAGEWRAMQHRLQPELASSNSIRDEIADWLNEHHSELEEI